MFTSNCSNYSFTITRTLIEIYRLYIIDLDLLN